MHVDPTNDPVANAAKLIDAASSDHALRPSIAGFFDEATNTVSYVVHDPVSMEAAIIDSVLDYEVRLRTS